jgi:diaminohydroxyphosphoribosylaminopyrimidine deaminase/5-amino-6-(5-phosphoribosylamino)uracil reductase
LSLPAGSDGRVSVPALLDALGRRRWTNVFVEGGAQVLGSFRDADAIDEVHVFIAPRLIGGSAAPGALAGQGVGRLADALCLSTLQIETFGNDLYVHGWRSPR